MKFPVYCRVTQDGNTYYGLSTDSKPTGPVMNGRAFVEMDTGKVYFFDADSGSWLEFGGS